MFYYILNIKMTSQSLSNFTELLTVAHNSVQKFDNDCDVILMFKMLQNICFHGISVKCKKWSNLVQ